MKGIFVTGTDTGIGKTFFTLACIRALQSAGIKTVAMKPVASGAQELDGKLVNDDALLIQQTLHQHIPYELINPYAFSPPVSPHIAAAQAGDEVDLQHIKKTYEKLSIDAEFAIVEGVGGWLAPLSDTLTVADMAREIGLPVVLVVGIRLGCLNHAMLTVEAIRHSGVALPGWVANCLDPAQAAIDDQLQYITEQLQQPPLAVMTWNETASVSPQELLHLSRQSD